MLFRSSRVNTKDTKDTKVGNHNSWRSQFVLRSVDDTVNPLTHVRNVEVQQQAEFVTGQPEVRQQLGSVDGKQLFNTFEFNDEAVFNDEVDTIGGGELHAFVNDRQMNLVLKMQASLRQFIEQTSVVRALEEAGPECGMNSHRSTDDDVTGFIRCH